MECPPGMNDELRDNIKYIFIGLFKLRGNTTKKSNSEKDRIYWMQCWSVPFLGKGQKGTCYVGLCIYNNLIIGHPKAVEDTIHELAENNLILKVDHN